MFFIHATWRTVLAMILTACVSIPLANAEPDERGAKRRAPPPEAIQACTDQTEGAACTFSGRRGQQLQGTCFVPPRDEQTLVCLPEGGPRAESRPEQAQ